jgi:hypothetical protein
MPAKPRWHADVANIRRTVTSMTATPFLDRPAIERLFRVRSRQANYLMRGLGGYKTGTSSWVSREDLLLKLDQMAAPRGVPSAETERKSKVIDNLNKLRLERPRRISAPPPRRSADPLPTGVSISSPGELTIRFTSPEDLLTCILGLAKSATSDFAAFAAGLEHSPDEPQNNQGKTA